ncbi:cell envelope integrity protein TolA [Klebsiella variicola]|uniref:cell envelope integrity protein TolA n=1 Tax=Klebsiella variicola TaxID=244366 RepID=UPI00352BD045
MLLRQQKMTISLSPADFCNSAIRNAIVAEMYEPDAYKGKTCSIRISLQPDGSVNSATAKEGDAKFCKAAISAMTRAKIPAAPDDETYQRVKNTALDFRL